MERLVEWMLVSMGAPVACITPLVGATILTGWVRDLYVNAKGNVERSGGSIWHEVTFILSIVLAVVALSGVWTALQVLLAMI